MSRLSNREKILTHGLRVVHERGYGGASVRDIVEAAQVPQGSFTNHFASKEAFGLEILNLYFANTCAIIEATLKNDSLPPLQRLHAYFDAHKKLLLKDDLKNGCMYGNFSAEAACHSELIRRRVVEIFDHIQMEIKTCLRAAVKAGELQGTTKCNRAAAFILSSLQGAILLGKAQRSIAPVELFEQTLFSSVLH